MCECKVIEMPDQIFENPRLVTIYDYFDGEREDLDHYVRIAKNLKARSVLDVGCGTGCFASRLVAEGFEVTAVDPARSSLEFARSKPNTAQVVWLLGDATTLPPMRVDLAMMTGNVAQVFLSDENWESTLQGIRRALNPGGHFVFEVRDPSKRAWLEWTPEKTYQRLEVPCVGFVEGWCEVTDVHNELVTFRWTYVFESDGQVITSDSTLRFRDREAIELSLRRAGYIVKDVLDAPDRPGKEFVFISALE